ncbi:MAG: hypothetical protein ACSLFA_12440 [Mycobacterium sp.]
MVKNTTTLLAATLLNAGAACPPIVIAVAAIAAVHTPYHPGEIPCHTVEGVPYFTPAGDPC